MVDDDKLQKLKERIDTAETTNSLLPKQKSKVVLDLDLRLAPKSSQLGSWVGIGLIVDKYLGTKPFGLIIFFIFGAIADF